MQADNYDRPWLNDAEKKLVAALRSGKYTQATGRLRRGSPETPAYCCLGVACEISSLGKWSDSLDCPIYPDYPIYVVGAPGAEERVKTHLPRPVQAWLGWADEGGNLYSTYEYALTTLNDDGFTFDQIADIIEAGLVRKDEGE